MNNKIQSEIVRGKINSIILCSLYDGDKYGYEIGKLIEKKTKGQYKLKEPTLYSSLKRLEKQGMIYSYYNDDDSSGGGRRRYYTLTEKGKEYGEKYSKQYEYNRTVYDKLISEKQYDLTTPPPEDEAITRQISKNLVGVYESDFDLDKAQQDRDKEDIEVLSEKIEVLSEKVERLESETEDGKTETYNVTYNQTVNETYNHTLNQTEEKYIGNDYQPTEERTFNNFDIYGASRQDDVQKTKPTPPQPSRDDLVYRSKLNRLFSSAATTEAQTPPEPEQEFYEPEEQFEEQTEFEPVEAYSLLPHETTNYPGGEQPTENYYANNAEIKQPDEYESDEFKVSVYDRSRVMGYKQYLYKNKLLAATLSLVYLLLIAELALVYLLGESALRMGLATYGYIALCLLIIPIFGIAKLIVAPNALSGARMNYLSVFVNAVLFTLYALFAIVVINLIISVNFSNYAAVVEQIILPGVLALHILLGTIIYELLHKSRKFHV